MGHKLDEGYSKASPPMCFRMICYKVWRLVSPSAVLFLLAGLYYRASCQPPPLSMPPRQWAVETAANEVAILHHSDVYLRYRMHMVDPKGDQVRDVIESKDGTVARLLLRDGRALTPDEDAAERERLSDMLNSPAAYAKHVRSEESGKKMAADLVAQMPDAMIYTYAPGQPQVGQNEGAGEVVLDYQPNPEWKPTSTPAEALTGLRGRMWIDIKTRQMIRMEGEIFKPVNFGWGMLAHIYPGGKLLLEQTDAGKQRWIYKRFQEQVSVRALMVKALNIHTEIEASQFQVLASTISYQEAIRQLLATPLPTR